MRDELLGELKRNNRFDVIVIGGGATGLWTALDAVSRGYRTVLVEKNDFASSASSKSTKLFHGGLRYLKQGHLKLVREALIERDLIFKNASHLVQKKEFLVPFYSKWEALYYGIGIQTYEFLSGSFHPNRKLSPKACLEKCPTLIETGLNGGRVYLDGQFDDARLAIELVKTALEFGALLLNYAPVHSFIKEKGKVIGVSLVDSIGGEFLELYGNAIINATGVYSDVLLKLDNPVQEPIMALSRGTHIVVDQKFLPKETAIVVPKTKDNRMIFIIPWLGKVLIGTTDVKTIEPIQDPSPTEIEIDFLLKTAAPYLSSSPTKSDILSVFSGIRPLVKASSKKTTGALLRNHKIEVSESGLISILGGKWTIGRKMAEDAIHEAIHLNKLEPIVCKTKKLPLHQTTKKGSSPLLHPALPYDEEDVLIAVQEEMAETLEDVLARRTRALLLDARTSLFIAPKVASIMASALNKPPSWQVEAIEKYENFAKKYCL